MTTISRGRTLGEQVYDHIRERIINGYYRPGQVIVETELAAELNVSRTPVSNALIMLRERGLLEEQNGKLAVPKLTIEDVSDLYHCRLALDGLATRLAAETISEKDLKRLECHLRVWEQPTKEDDLHALWVADLSFHEIIYQVSGNRHLMRFAQIAAELAAVYQRNIIRRLGDDPTGRSDRSKEDVRREHQRILEALAARDPDRAEQAAREHVLNVIRHLGHMEVIESDSTVNDRAH